MNHKIAGRGSIIRTVLTISDSTRLHRFSPPPRRTGLAEQQIFIQSHPLVAIAAGIDNPSVQQNPWTESKFPQKLFF